MKIGSQDRSTESSINKEIQTEPIVEESKGSGSNVFEGGTQEHPVMLDDEELDPHETVSDDEDLTADPVESLNLIEDDKYFFGTVFEKVEEFDHHLDDPNP